MDSQECILLQFYSFIGKKWHYPILYHFRPNQGYRYEDLIYVTKRKISRTLLSNFLKESIGMGIIAKKDNLYCLTDLGSELQKEFRKLRRLFIKDCGKCNKDCLVEQERF
jgi:DNA-binding HxlR family transcriptional regulator